MRKLKLLGLGNEENRSYFIFEKTLDFFPSFSYVLEMLNIEKKGNFISYNSQEVIDEDITDNIEHLFNELYDIDIIYGKDKIFVIIRTESDRDDYIRIIKDISSVNLD